MKKDSGRKAHEVCEIAFCTRPWVGIFNVKGKMTKLCNKHMEKYLGGGK